MSRSGNSRSKLVQAIQRGDLVGLRERRVVEYSVPEVLDRAAESEHCLADVDQFGRSFAQGVDAEDREFVSMEQDLEESSLVTDDLSP
jgi:hypothetical protein